MALLTERDAAQVLAVKPETLRAWRFRGEGPAYTKLGRLVRYREDDLLAFARAGRVEPEAAGAGT